MKLITEISEDIKVQIVEDSPGSEKKLYIEGVFMQGAIKNRNGRRYPMEILDREAEKYVEEKVLKNRAWGELNHPEGPTINLDRVSHRIVELRRDGNNYVGRAIVMNEGLGKTVRGLLEIGGNIGVSSRGLGSLKPARDGIMEVQEDFRLVTAGDIVSDPSAPDAFVNGILEGVDFAYDEDSHRFVAMARRKLSSTKKIDESTALSAWERWLDGVVYKR